MAEEVKKEVKKAEAKTKGKTYRNRKYASFKFLVKTAPVGEPSRNNVYVRFVPYVEVFKGDPVKVGYLQTDDKKIQERCEEYNFIEEISQKEFDESTDPKKARRARG